MIFDRVAVEPMHIMSPKVHDQTQCREIYDEINCSYRIKVKTNAHMLSVIS